MSQAELRIQYLSQNKNSKYFRILFLIIVISSIIVSSFFLVKWMNNTSRFSVSKLIVTGSINYTNYDDILQTVLSIGPQKNLMLQNVNIIRQQIEHLPGIKHVNVRKHWPNMLIINISEYEPLAIWNDSHLMDSNGIFFDVPIGYNVSQNILNFYGPKGSEKEILANYQIILNISKANNFKIKSILVSDQHCWQLVVDENICLILGEDYFIDRFYYFRKFYHKLKNQIISQNHRINYIDLRYASGASLLCKNKCVNL